jgi:hypothetical protein
LELAFPFNNKNIKTENYFADDPPSQLSSGQPNPLLAAIEIFNPLRKTCEEI